LKKMLAFCPFSDILMFRVDKMTTTLKQLRAVGYTRVSTDKQADKGVSLEAQVEKIRAMGVVQGAEVMEIITDAESAKSLERPGMARLLAMVDAGEVQVVIITKLDRLTRSVADLGALLKRFQKRGVSLVSMSESLDTGSAAGRMVMNIMASVSQWEREAIAERTATALQFKRQHRRVFNHTPYGFTRDGDALVICADEQNVIERVKAQRAGGWTLQKIADVLNEDGVPTKRGSQWAPQTVSNVLTSSMHKAAA
jgi:site-specific DNA recombinase